MKFNRWIAEETSLPRSWVLANPRAWTIFPKAKKPWIELHLRGEGHLCEEDYLMMLLKVSHFLKNNLKYAGAFSASWFYDPAIKHISPRLAFLQEDILTQGGKIVNVNRFCNSQTVSALQKSQTRRIAYMQGLYKPKVYCAIMENK